jgi:ribosomal protein S18 acetylase RimI-like enzyme
MTSVPKVLRGDRSHIDGAAQVWAEATAARDGDAEVAPLALSRPIIASVVERPRAVLVLAIDEGDQVVAFAVAAPVPDGSSSPAATAEVEYVGVSPRHWGQGLARSALRLLCAELAADGFTDAQLLVYVSNHRAAALYEELGWQPSGEPRPHRRTGKPEQRYHLTLPG